MRHQLQIPEAESKAPQWCLGLPRHPPWGSVRPAAPTGLCHMEKQPGWPPLPQPAMDQHRSARTFHGLNGGPKLRASSRSYSRADLKLLPTSFSHKDTSESPEPLQAPHTLTDWGWEALMPRLRFKTCPGDSNSQWESGSSMYCSSFSINLWLTALFQKHDPVFFLPFLFLDHTTRIIGSQLPTRSQTWARQWKHKALTTGPLGTPNGLLFLKHSFPYGSEARIRTHRLVLLPGEVLSVFVLKLVWCGWLFLTFACLHSLSCMDLHWPYHSAWPPKLWMIIFYC